MTRIITQRDIDSAREQLAKIRKMRKGGVPEAQERLKILIDAALKQRFAAPATFGSRLRAAWRLILGESA